MLTVVMEEDSDSFGWIEEKDDEPIALNACLNALLYQDGGIRNFTHTTLKMIEESKGKLGEANTLFIEGIRRFAYHDIAFKYLSEAEKKGCKHPVLYYFLGDCYRSGYKGVDVDDDKALHYFNKAMEGMSWGVPLGFRSACMCECMYAWIEMLILFLPWRLFFFFPPTCAWLMSRRVFMESYRYIYDVHDRIQ